MLVIPRSKTNQTATTLELVVLPRAGHPDRCPVTALDTWLELSGITDGPVLRDVRGRAVVSVGGRPDVSLARAGS